MKLAFLSAFAALFFITACQPLSNTSAAITDYTGLTQVEQICLARSVAIEGGFDVSEYDSQLALYGIICEEKYGDI